MNRYWAVVAVLVLFFLILFLGVEALGVPLLTDPCPSRGVGARRQVWRAQRCSPLTCCCPCRPAW